MKRKNGGNPKATNTTPVDTLQVRIYDVELHGVHIEPTIQAQRE